MKNKDLPGFLMGVGYVARMNEIHNIVMLQRAIDSEIWKSLGFDNAKDFIRKVTGGSYETFHEKSKRLKSLGSEVVSILTTLGMGLKDVRLIEHAVTDDGSGKKVLKIDDNRQIPWAEDRLSELQAGIDLLREQRDSERKETKRQREKINKLDEEIKKREETFSKQEKQLQAQIDSMTSPKAMLDVISNLDRIFMEFERTMQFVFSPKLYDDRPTQGKIINIIEDMKSRIMRLDQRLDAFLAAENSDK